MLASFWMLSNVYLSERRWRILKRREPRLDISDSSSSMMSCGVLSFFPRSMARPPGAQQALCTAYYSNGIGVLLYDGYGSDCGHGGSNLEISTHSDSIALTSILLIFFVCALTVALPGLCAVFVIGIVTETVNYG